MTIISKSKFLEFKSAKSPSGHDWYYVRRTNDTTNHDSAVVISTLVFKNGKYNFLFLKTKRPPIYAENKAKYCLEFPAGLIGDTDINENLFDCIKKELLEEAGLYADKIFIELKNSSTSAGLSCETLTYATVIVDDYKEIQKPVDDGGIICERFLVKEDKVLDYLNEINQNEISISSVTVCAIFFAKERLKRL